MPGFTESPRLGMAMGFTLTQLVSLAPDRFPERALEAISRDLEALHGDAGQGRVAGDDAEERR